MFYSFRTMVIYITEPAWFTVTSEDGVTWYATLFKFRKYQSGEPPGIIELKKVGKKWTSDAPDYKSLCDDLCEDIERFASSIS